MINHPQEEQNASTAISGLLDGILPLKPDYMRVADPTEYSFATRYAGGWDTWQALCETQEFAPVIGRWRKELAQKLRSDAFAKILDTSYGETRDAIQACKYIYEELSQEEDKKSKVGRPSKEAIAREASKLMEDDRAREEAYRRLFSNPD